MTPSDLLLPDPPATRRERLRNRLTLLRLIRLRAASLTGPGDPRHWGDARRGAALMEGRIAAGGQVVELGTGAPWGRDWPPAVQAALHGHGWLDDLAALGTEAALLRGRDWLRRWIARHGGGSGPGWTPAIAGRRSRHWVAHAEWLAPEPDPALARALTRQVRFLAVRAPAAPPGLPRAEALTGLIVAALALEGEAGAAEPAALALAAELRRQVGEEGIPSRNPEELLALAALAGTAARALAAAGHAPPAGLIAAVERAAPVLRTLRHADGSLARFQGGGAPPEGAVEAVISGHPGPAALQAMGYARLKAGRTSVLVDAAAPLRGSSTAHASTGAFELTSGRRPLITSCGPGQGEPWERAARATQSHSALAVEGFSSSRLGPGDRLTDIPAHVQADRRDTAAALGLSVRQDGYRATHGLTHVRELELSRDGARLRGYDLLSATTEEEIARLARARAENRGRPVAFAIHFHLHPEVEAAEAQDAVTLTLRHGERWVFRHDRAAHLSLEPSAWLTPGGPVPARQIVLSGLIRGEAAHVGWTLAKAEDSAQAIRDTLPGPFAAPI